VMYHFVLSNFQKIFIGALSQKLPRRDMDATIPN